MHLNYNDAYSEYEATYVYLSCSFVSYSPLEERKGILKYFYARQVTTALKSKARFHVLLP